MGDGFGYTISFDSGITQIVVSGGDSGTRTFTSSPAVLDSMGEGFDYTANRATITVTLADGYEIDEAIITDTEYGHASATVSDNVVTVTQTSYSAPWDFTLSITTKVASSSPDYSKVKKVNIIDMDGNDFSFDLNTVQDSKSITITENGTTTITPDDGYDGVQAVNITTNVESQGSWLGGSLDKIPSIDPIRFSSWSTSSTTYPIGVCVTIPKSIATQLAPYMGFDSNTHALGYQLSIEQSNSRLTTGYYNGFFTYPRTGSIGFSNGTRVRLDLATTENVSFRTISKEAVVLSSSATTKIGLTRGEYSSTSFGNGSLWMYIPISTKYVIYAELRAYTNAYGWTVSLNASEKTGSFGMDDSIAFNPTKNSNNTITIPSNC